MRRSGWTLRRLILGMSVEDAQSKFDTPETRTKLRVAHERHNLGILHELQLAQRQRNELPSERKCHISRYTKPSARGFQGYVKEQPEDYVVMELWDDKRNKRIDAEGETPATGKGGKYEIEEHNHRSASSPVDSVPAVGTKIRNERDRFRSDRQAVLSTLSNALDMVCEDVLAELTDRRQRGALLTGQQGSVVNRLVDEVSEASGKGYKALSSSSHLLEPVEVSVTLFSKKDRAMSDAFKSNILSFPASDGDISFSLWVSGGVIANERLCSEFPFHIAKYVVNHRAPDSIPRAGLEIYFSPELYQLQQAIGMAGILTLRQFVGKIMMKQHEPSPSSSSILLNASTDDKVLYNVINPLRAERIALPWVQRKKAKVSLVTGVVLNAWDDPDNSTAVEKMREGIQLVWRAWGHLIKDFHVHGDLDFLYVSIDRQREITENEEYIDEVRKAEQTGTRVSDPNTAVSGALQKIRNALTVIGAPHEDGKVTRKRRKCCLPIPADFTVVECVLEKKGMPHNMVVEDIVESLTEMQAHHLEMLRLSLMEEVDAADDELLQTIVPVLYAPKIVVSHAGVIENGTHSFQRIRIRGSSLAHVEALAKGLESGDHFTDRSDIAAVLNDDADVQWRFHSTPLPPNQSFSATHSPATLQRRKQGSRLIGHHHAVGSGRAPHQSMGLFDESIVSEDEREFWREHFYRLSDAQLIFHDRVDPTDIHGKEMLPPRLQHHLQLTANVLSAGAVEEGAAGGTRSGRRPSESSGTGKNTKRSRARRGQKKNPVAALSDEKLFEYLCTDMETELASYDLRTGDCQGYSYTIRVRKIPEHEIDLVPPSVRLLQSKGFINYFGPTRFAGYTRMNMHPGLHLLKGEFRAAAHIIVQQFHLDASLAAAKQRTGSPFPKLMGLNGTGYRMEDIVNGNRRRGIAENGTAMQIVLNNALQATTLLHGEGEAEELGVDSSVGRNRQKHGRNAYLGQDRNGLAFSGKTISAADGPCAEAFLNVIGPNACRILVYEFIAFVWNEIVNQRLQRYGTFSILPGDLVKIRNNTTGVGSAWIPRHELALASRSDIEKGTYSHWDVVLPVPGAAMALPENHTADLYAVTLKRYGLVMNPESRQWDCFYGSPSNNMSDSPYRKLASSYALMEEEIGCSTPSVEPIPFSASPTRNGMTHRPSQEYWKTSSTGSGAHGMELIASGDMYGEILFGGEDDGVEDMGTNAVAIRSDLRVQHGNPLGIMIEAGYRHPLLQPPLEWSLRKGTPGDPLQRWGQSLNHAFPKVTEASQIGATATLRLGDTDVSSVNALAPSQEVSHPATSASLDVAGVPPFLARNPLQLRSIRKSQRHGNGSSRTKRSLPLPAAPYWLPKHGDSSLELQCVFPTGIYPSMMLRELMKLDVNVPEVVSLNRPLASRRSQSWDSLTHDQQVTYRKYLTKRRQRTFSDRPRAVTLALLHQQIFRSGGIRNSLIPTLRSYDSVSK